MKSRLIELTLSVAPFLSFACTTESGDGGGAGAPGVSGSGGSAGAAAGSGGTGAGSGGTSAGAAGTTSGGGGTGGTAGGGGSGGGDPPAPFVLTSPAFEHNDDCAVGNLGPCEVFPLEQILDTFQVDGQNGGNISPELNWGPGPEGTMSYAIVLHDYSNGFTHWAIWNIPATTLQLPHDLPRETNPATPAGAQQVSFSDNDGGYQGPGALQHVYEFRLYALSSATFSPGNAGDQNDVRNDLENSDAVLGTSDLRGKSTE